MKETGAEVIGLDWRDSARPRLGEQAVSGAVQGNLDPVLLFGGWKEVRQARQPFCGEPADVPGIFLIWGMAFCRRRRWRT